MARANLSAMLGRLDDPTEEAPPVSVQSELLPSREPATAEVESTQPAKRNRSNKPAAKLAKVENAASSDEPQGRVGFRQFDRKEARLRSDQYVQLTEHARRLNRAKGTGGERITENTLIRIAIDQLFDQIYDLKGATEEELRASIRNRSTKN